MNFLQALGAIARGYKTGTDEKRKRQETEDEKAWRDEQRQYLREQQKREAEIAPELRNLDAMKRRYEVKKLENELTVPAPQLAGSAVDTLSTAMGAAGVPTMGVAGVPSLTTAPTLAGVLQKSITPALTASVPNVRVDRSVPLSTQNKIEAEQVDQIHKQEIARLKAELETQKMQERFAEQLRRDQESRDFRRGMAQFGVDNRNPPSERQSDVERVYTSVYKDTGDPVAAEKAVAEYEKFKASRKPKVYDPKQLSQKNRLVSRFKDTVDNALKKVPTAPGF